MKKSLFKAKGIIPTIYFQPKVIFTANLIKKPLMYLLISEFNEMQSKINSMDLERPVESKMTDERPLHSLKTNASNKLNCMQYDD